MWMTKTLQRHAYDLEKPDVDKAASKAQIKFCEIFPGTTGFVIAIEDQVISASNWKLILKDPSIRNCTCRKCRQKSETIRHITGACTVLALGADMIVTVNRPTLCVKN
jgi:DICT domain-containing protein